MSAVKQCPSGDPSMTRALAKAVSNISLSQGTLRKGQARGPNASIWVIMDG